MLEDVSGHRCIACVAGMPDLKVVLQRCGVRQKKLSFVDLRSFEPVRWVPPLQRRLSLVVSPQPGNCQSTIDIRHCAFNLLVCVEIEDESDVRKEKARSSVQRCTA